MSKQRADAVEAFRIARDWALANGVPWEPDFSINRSGDKWHVQTNCGALGCNLMVTICRRSGRVLDHHWNPE